MFLNTLASEWIKLRTTKSFWWTSALFIFFSVGMAALMGAFSEDQPLLANGAAVGVYMFGFIVIAVQAVMVVTTEYRHRYQSVTYLATPKRWMVAVAKLLLYLVLGMLLTLVTVALCYLVAGWLAPSEATVAYEPFSSEEGRRLLWAYPVMAGLMIIFSQGIALLLRQTAGAVTLVLMWYLALEGVIAMLPKVGDKIRNYGPFENLNAFVSNFEIQDVPWGVIGSGVYFAVWAVVIWVAGVILLQKRDA
ncbi:multidrug ABC transporter permease [Corynebacterium halotolerans]|uniref:multidrug ABC transporter permease n=1 Tax=Corynebacterium halotolerans TaxID=225326 RepID=UPI003CF8BCAE